MITDVLSKNIRVSVDGAVAYAHRFSAVGSGDVGVGDGVGGCSCGSLRISASVTGTTDAQQQVELLSGHLPHFVYLPEDDDCVDWDIVNLKDVCPGQSLLQELHQEMNYDISGLEENAIKLVQITLLKAVPMVGVNLWWSQPLTNCVKIDVNEIKNRRESDRDQNLKNVWQEAHEEFKKKLKDGKLNKQINL